MSLGTSGAGADQRARRTTTRCRTTEPEPIRQSSSTVQPSRWALCPTTQSSPITCRASAVQWSTVPSWTEVRAPTTIAPWSPRSTAVGQTVALGADAHVADDDGVGVHERGRVDLRDPVAQGVERHPRSFRSARPAEFGARQLCQTIPVEPNGDVGRSAGDRAEVGVPGLAVGHNRRARGTGRAAGLNHRSRGVDGLHDRSTADDLDADHTQRPARRPDEDDDGHRLRHPAQDRRRARRGQPRGAQGAARRQSGLASTSTRPSSPRTSSCPAPTCPTRSSPSGSSRVRPTSSPAPGASWCTTAASWPEENGQPVCRDCAA